MSEGNTELVPAGQQEHALSWGGQLTTTELKDACVAEARKQANIRIREFRELIKTSADELQEKVKELTKACEERAKGFMQAELETAAKALQAVFSVPVIHKITPLEGTFNEERKTFKVQVSIGFENRTPGIPKINGSSNGFDQDLYMQSEIENGDAVQALYDAIDELRKTRKGYTEEVAQLEDFLDCGVQVLEDEFVSRVTRAKLATCKDGDKILGAINDAMSDSGVQQLLPKSLAGTLGNQALPAPKES